MQCSLNANPVCTFHNFWIVAVAQLALWNCATVQLLSQSYEGNARAPSQTQLTNSPAETCATWAQKLNPAYEPSKIGARYKHRWKSEANQEQVSPTKGNARALGQTAR